MVIFFSFAFSVVIVDGGGRGLIPPPPLLRVGTPPPLVGWWGGESGRDEGGGGLHRLPRASEHTHSVHAPPPPPICGGWVSMCVRSRAEGRLHVVGFGRLPRWIPPPPPPYGASGNAPQTPPGGAVCWGVCGLGWRVWCCGGGKWVMDVVRIRGWGGRVGGDVCCRLCGACGVRWVRRRRVWGEEGGGRVGEGCGGGGPPRPPPPPPPRVGGLCGGGSFGLGGALWGGSGRGYPHCNGWLLGRSVMWLSRSTPIVGGGLGEWGVR